MINKYIRYRICKDYMKIENYEEAANDKENVWICHHRLETHFSDGTLRPVEAQLTREELMMLDMYFHRPPEELIFLKKIDHARLHMKDKPKPEEVVRKRVGRKMSEETKRKISEANKGKPSWNKGKVAWNKGKHYTKVKDKCIYKEI